MDFSGRIATMTTVLKPTEEELKEEYVGGLDVKYHPKIDMDTTKVKQIYVDLDVLKGK